MTYELAVYASQELDNYCDNNYSDPDRAQLRAAEYINNAFYRKGIDAIVRTPSERPNPPTEIYDQGFTVPNPCYTQINTTYVSLLGWFKDWMGCNAPIDAADSNILITSTEYPDGGQAYVTGTRGVAQTGRYIADTPSPAVDYGDELKHSGVETILHEIAHNLTRGGLDEDYPENQDPYHDLGYYQNRSVGNAISPIGVNGSYNLCNKAVPSTSAWELTWSDCCVNYWRAANYSG